jgi:hypothetical protein
MDEGWLEAEELWTKLYMHNILRNNLYAPYKMLENDSLHPLNVSPLYILRLGPQITNLYKTKGLVRTSKCFNLDSMS